jgi:hypothetical protein
MSRMKVRFMLVLWLAVPVLAGAASPFAQKCDLEGIKPELRVFAKTDASAPWRSFQSTAKLPDLENDSGMTAQIWRAPAGSFLVRIDGPGEDFATFTNYCFDQAGTLRRIRFEVRTAWGWGYRLDSPTNRGSNRLGPGQFFNTKTEKAIPRPAQAADISDALKPTIYKTARSLPFDNLLTHPR